jgi:ABC-2 type transport system ATP-binding protein
VTDPQSAPPATVVVEDVTQRFGDFVAVDGVSFAVPEGTILGLIGPSGAGKTTVVRMLTGALAPTSGSVRVLGEDPRRFRRTTREQIGYMPQLFSLYPDLTARENVDFVASLFGMLFRRRHQRTRAVLEIVDLWEARGRRAGNLSGGMQRRLELACALVHQPALMFLDEPTTGIDPLLRTRIWDELQRLRSDGRTMLVTTQYLAEAELCDNVVLIANGRLVAYDTPDGLRRAAIGGDIVDVETVHAFDGAVLEELPSVVSTNQLGPRHVQVVVDDAGSATPTVMDAIAERGGEVESAREYRPTFDEIFAALVRRDCEARGEPADAEAVA